MLRYQDWKTGADISSLPEGSHRCSGIRTGKQEQTLLVYVKDLTDAQVSGLGAGADTSSLRQ
jgi:hypothetical protein